jgi:hypothetical protein
VKITPDVIDAIFRVHPSIHAAYNDNVPDKLSERDFWNK